MHTPTTSNQNRGTGLLLRYDGAVSDEYLSDSNDYTDNGSDLESDNYNDYESNCEFDNEETPCTSISITETPLAQLPNVKERKTKVTNTLRQEKFNDNFSSKDLLNEIRKIALSPPK